MSLDQVRDSLLLEEQLLLLAAAGLLLPTIMKEEEVERKRKQRTLWVRTWLLRREDYGQYENLLHELHREDPKGYKNFLRVTPDIFHELVTRLTPYLDKKDTFMRKSLSPGHRVCITLRYMATGDSYHSLMYNFRVAHNTISKIVRETSEAIIQEFSEELLPCPKSPEAWTEVANQFSKRWNFHNTLGALDGKHIAIKCPPSSGSYYFNYKNFHSVVLLALVDANYKFLYTDIGANGCVSDGGIFKDSNIYEALEMETAGIPPHTPLPNDDVPIPYAIVGDDAFGLRTWLMKPFPHRAMTREERIFNYRLSRARRVVENAFGILAHRYLQ